MTHTQSEIPATERPWWPQDIPPDIRAAALAAFDAPKVEGELFSVNYIVPIARALMAERDACAARAGNYLMLKTPLDVPRIVACEEAIRGAA